MQTFLPYADFSASMATLDNSRLGNQVYREGMTLLRGKWPNHPASKMWRGYEMALVRYLIRGVEELHNRGKDYSNRPWCIELYDKWDNAPDSQPLIIPPWNGDDRLHSSHRANLLRKDYAHYSKFGWSEVPGDKYWWPV